MSQIMSDIKRSYLLASPVKNDILDFVHILQRMGDISG